MAGRPFAGASTCLGCGCACDDMDVSVADSQILSVHNACDLGVAWFGDGDAPRRVLIDGVDSSLEDALTLAASLLARAARPRVVLGADVSCETYREAVGCADDLRARLDIAIPPASLVGVLASQERGVATATLGEIRNRADIIVFWGVDPSRHYPRYQTRYAPGPRGAHIPEGRRSRTVIGVSIGDDDAPSDADVHLAISAASEHGTLVTLAALLAGTAGASTVDPASPAAALAEHLRDGRYVAFVADIEADVATSAGRIHRLLAVTQALNVRGRGALSLLRGGGNLSGAESVVVRHTGYPGSVDFATGAPRYAPYAGSVPAHFDVSLLVGSDRRDEGRLSPSVVIGPAASRLAGQARVAIDSATAGIHSGGTAVRMDDVPLPLRALVSGPPDATLICQALRRLLPPGITD